MKPILSFLLLLCGLPGGLFAQLHVAGGTLKISAGATLHSTGNLTNTGGGTLVNEGTLNTPGSITNSGAAMLSGNGQYHLQGNWTNSANYNAGTSTVRFQGNANSTVSMGGDAFFILEIGKGNGTNIMAADDLSVDGQLDFVQNNNKVLLGDNDLVLGSSAAVSGADANNFIVTNGTGFVIKEGLGAAPFTFPVGFNTSSYNPLSIVQGGTADAFGVRCREHVLANGSSGSVFNNGVVDASWEVAEGTPGGSELSLTAQWAGADELSGFDRTDCGLAHHNGTNWDLTPALTGNAAGFDPYLLTRNGVTELGVFAVGIGMQLISATDEPFSGWQVGEPYPNPIGRAGAWVKLPINNSVAATFQVQLFDNLGRRIGGMKTAALPNGQALEMEIPPLAAGVYHLRIMDGERVLHKEMVVQ